MICLVLLHWYFYAQEFRNKYEVHRRYLSSLFKYFKVHLKKIMYSFFTQNFMRCVGLASILYFIRNVNTLGGIQTEKDLYGGTTLNHYLCKKTLILCNCSETLQEVLKYDVKE